MTPTIDAMRSDLPRATVRWRQEGLTQKNCDVLVDGQVVAVLPVCSFAYTADRMSSLPMVTLSLHASDVDIATFDPASLDSSGSAK